MEQIVSVTHGIWIHKNLRNPHPAFISLDSRKVVFPDLTVFFAIKSHHQNANLFIDNLYKNGVRNFVTDDKEIDIAKIPLANVVVVSNTVDALQALAIHHRNQFKNHFRVIGITGSNGKTIVKEWLNQLLEKHFSIVRSPKSFNSQIGVPLSVLNINAANNLGIFEAGISQPSEMQKLEKIVQPDIGILTNIGNAHDEGFKNRKQKIREKLILFKRAQHLIFCSDDTEVYDEITIFQSKNNRQLQLFSWGTKSGNALQIKSIKSERRPICN